MVIVIVITVIRIIIINTFLEKENDPKSLEQNPNLDIPIIIQGTFICSKIYL